MTSGPGRRRLDVAFFVGLGLYALGGILILAQGLMAVAASLIPSLHESLHVTGLGTGFDARVALRIADASHAVPSWIQIVADYLFSIFHYLLAILFLRLRPGDWTARLLAVAMVGVAGIFNLTSQAVFEELSFTPLEAWGQIGGQMLAGLAYVYALLIFPDGRPVPRWPARKLIPIYLTAAAAAMFISLRLEGSARPAALLLLFGVLVPIAGAAAQGYRIFHTEDATSHAQARLLFWSLLPSVGIGLAFLALNGLAPTTNVLAGRGLVDPPIALYRTFQPAFALIPVALLLGMLRYRLWDIERVVNRTTVYAIATGLLGGAYAAVAVLLQLAFGTVAASPLLDSKPAVAITTWLFLAAFRPVRDRVQLFIDRRFNRNRYDAQVTIEKLQEGLRDEVDLAGIVRRLEVLLAEIIQPSRISAWLRPVGDDSRPKNA